MGRCAPGGCFSKHNTPLSKPRLAVADNGRLPTEQWAWGMSTRAASAPRIPDERWAGLSSLSSRSGLESTSCAYAGLSTTPNSDSPGMRGSESGGRLLSQQGCLCSIPTLSILSLAYYQSSLRFAVGELRRLSQWLIYI